MIYLSEVSIGQITLQRSARQGRHTPETYDLYDLAHAAGWEPYDLHDLPHVSWVGPGAQDLDDL